ncbi:unnamed protein product [Rhizoctonia solani]|uniref:F-box domain-containing protein n=1 Tax=Rhizoctonia solani TaxID=456999 RepID=A0A8H3GVT1_9AGAM|nr:unnamed protein product [Rhizoctonia solani]
MLLSVGFTRERSGLHTRVTISIPQIPDAPKLGCPRRVHEGRMPSTSPVGPINDLPDDLLTCIFDQVLKIIPTPGGPASRRNAEWQRFMGYPILVSHVCSRWRRIMIYSSTFWCRIYIYPQLFNRPKCVTLLETYLNRAGQNLLDILIFDSPHSSHPNIVDWVFNDLFLTFLGTTVPRAKYLTLKSENGLFTPGHPRSTLAVCLLKCTPGTLEELTVDVATDDYPVSQAADMSLDLPRRTLEELWRSTPIMRFNGYYPYAINTSDFGASRGLTELRLKGWHPITETTLIGILTASPQLRVVEVSMDIIGSLTKGAPIEPIYLEHLEIVKSGILNRPLTHQRQLRILLRLLKPGSKPLGLCISNPNQSSDPTFVCQPEVRAFLARSNIQKLCVHDLERRSHLVELLKLAPSVRALAIPALRSLEPDVGALPTEPSLDALYVIPSFLSLRPGSVPSPSSNWPTVEWLAETYHFKELTLWTQDFEFGYSREQLIPENLHTICSLVNVMAWEAPNPVQEWC